MLAFTASLQAQLISVGGDEALSLTNGSLFSVAGLEFEPTATFTLQNTQLTKQTNSANSAGISNTSLVFVFSNTTAAFTGSVQVAYTSSELGGLIADSLAISVYSASQWNRILPSNVNTVSQKVSATLAALSMKEITLQLSSTITSPSLTTSSSLGTPPGIGGSLGGSSSVSTSTTISSSTATETAGTGDTTGAVDDDGDGYLTEIELVCGTDPYNSDSFPSDFDADGVPDCLDEDDDADGYPDTLEIDCGYDRLNTDLFPPDFDGDGLVDCIDPDDDDDGYADQIDSFPFDQNEWMDTDGDGIGNNTDTDDDNDCFSDELEIAEDTQPLDVLDYPTDVDRDCIPDRIDTDLNNDGIADTELILPEIFSPNGDGINDTLVITNITNYPNNTVYIFSRSGLELVRIRNYNNSWSGTYRGEAVPAGSYLIALDTDGDGSIDVKGWIYLTR